MYDSHGLLQKSSHRASQEARAEQCYASAYQALASGQDADARRLFGALAVMMPRDERPWIGLAVCHERLANWAMAAAMYGMGSVIATSAWSLFGRGRALKRLGKRTAGLRVLQSAAAATTDPEILTAIDEERSQP